MTVVGTDWFGGCNDSVTGCFQHAGQVDPIQGATISIAAARRRPRDERAWKPEGTASVIGTADADEHGNLSLTNVAMPSEAGTYVLITDMPYPSYFPVRIT